MVCYLDLACPRCAALWSRLRAQPLRVGFRHFPLATRRPRSPELHAAVEAAGAQRSDAFAAMVELIYGDHGHLDDPHLWVRAERLGLDLGRFEADRRSAAVAGRVRAAFASALRGGVSAAPTALIGRRTFGGEALEAELKSLLAGAEAPPEPASGRVNIAG